MSYYSELKNNIQIISATQLASKEEIDAIKNVSDKADLLVGDGVAPSTLSSSSGFDGNILVQDSTQQVGLKWSITNHLPLSGVTAGSYNMANVSVDSTGLITAASNGSIDINDIVPTTTKGDLIVENSVPELDRLPNSNIDGEILIADSTEPTGIRWDTLNINSITPTFAKGDIIARSDSVLTRVAVGVDNTIFMINPLVTSTGLGYGTLNNIVPTTQTGDLIVHDSSGNLNRLENSTINNQILVADNTNTLLGVSWKSIDIDDITPTTTKGDIMVHNNAGQLDRLPNSNTNNEILTVDNAEPTGLKWQAVGSSEQTIFYTTIKQEGMWSTDRNNTYLAETNIVDVTSPDFNDMWRFSFPVTLIGIRVNLWTANIYQNKEIVTWEIVDPADGSVLPGTSTPYDMTGQTAVNDGVILYMLDTPLAPDVEFGFKYSFSRNVGNADIRYTFQIIYT